MVIALAACNTVEKASAGGVAAAALVSGVAWNERVELRDQRIPQPPSGGSNVRLRVRVGHNPPFTANVLFQAQGRVVFDLPAPPALPPLPADLPYSLEPGSYNQPPTPAQQASYTDRGTVTVQVLNAANQVVGQQDYQPYGAVEPGELTAIREVDAGSCFSLPDGFRVVDSQLSTVGGSRVCYITANIGNRGTQQAIAQLLSARPGLSVDKNTVNGLDPTDANSFDPTCSQIINWLNPIGGSGFATLNPAQLASATNAQAASVRGSGVKVYVVGGGFGASDGFSCPVANFQGHDTHVKSIILSLAPGADVEAKEVCSNAGNCPSSSITRALLDIAAEAATSSQDILVNMSLGGPLPNSAMFKALQLMQDRVLVVTSGGNGPYAPDHFPASYSSDLPDPGLLSNVLSVAAAGLKNGLWGVAGFNTRRNAGVFAPAINLCPDSLLGFRCKNSLPKDLDDLGATGSSFAAPVGTGLAALYLEETRSRPLSPLRLRQCLSNTALANPFLSRMVWFQAGGC